MKSSKRENKSVAETPISFLDKILEFESSLNLDNLPSVLDTCLKLFKNELGADNCYWFLGTRLEKMVEQFANKQRVQIPRSVIGEACPQFLALNTKSQEQMSATVSQIAVGLSEISLDDVVQVFTSENRYMIWPVFSRDGKYKFGDILIENAQNWKNSWIEIYKNQVLKVVSRNIEEAIRFVKARELAFVDDLTGLFNQRYLATALDREIAQSKRQRHPFSVLFLDIDHFKKVNDQYGHVIGSKILGQLGNLIKTNIRGSDIGIRYGGDEYLLLLIGTGAESAKTAAERIRQLIANQSFVIDGNTYKITASIGVAAFPQHAENRERLINLADQAMYQSKFSGRNKIYIAE